jgi:hypothetical protein
MKDDWKQVFRHHRRLSNHRNCLTLDPPRLWETHVPCVKTFSYFRRAPRFHRSLDSMNRLQHSMPMPLFSVR